MGELNKQFARQISLQEIGTNGQLRIHAASVLVIGAGGLGCPILQYLAAAGVGKIGIADADRIDASNLPRQILYSNKDIGMHKAEVAAARIREMAPHAEVEYFVVELDHQNAFDLIQPYDFIVDATDQLHITYLLSDICLILDKTWIYGAVHRFEGQWAVFGSLAGNVTYRDAFPVPANPLLLPTCEQEGILGPVPGAIGLFMTMEIIKCITGLFKGVSELHQFQFKNNTMFSAEIRKLENKEILTKERFENTDYRQLLFQLQEIK